MKITLLCGGPSDEREISLISGNSVAQGLREAGHDVFISSIDVAICQTSDEVERAARAVLQRHEHAMAEQLIEGPELTVGLLEGEPLDPIRIVTKRAFFDYDAKYKAGHTEHHFDLNLPDE